MTESAKRLFLWAESNGGTSEISKRAGIDRQIFHSLKTKDIEPSLPTLKKIYSAFPFLDIHWVGTGEKREGIIYPNIDKLFIEVENEKLKEENTTLKTQLQEVKQEKNKLFDLLGKDEGMTNSLLIDTEQGVSLMHALLGSEGGHALSLRRN
jgi:hypothetical protein